MPFQPGETLLHYRIVKKLGEGGMGQVYLADDARLKRQVAIKLLATRLRDDPEFLVLFRREAEAAARLNHPAIATIHAPEETADTTFIVMEYVEGQPLSSKIPGGGMSLDRFFATFIPLAEGLAHAHALGRVHRDLKPGNVMIDASGSPKILDFGLARILDTSEASEVTSDSPTMARSIEDAGALVGTPSYMSPEQIERAGADPRSDLFSFGVMMYEALTGKAPFEGQSVSSLLVRILEAEPRPATELKPEASNQLWWVIRSCLRKRREARMQSAPELVANLREARQSVDEVPDKEPPPPGWRQPALLAYAAVALAAGIAAAWFLKPAPEQELPARKFTREIAPYASVVAALVESSAISPDGSMLAYNDASGGNTALWVREFASVTPRELPATRGAMAPFWSPDNRYVGFFTSDTPATLNRTPVDGGPGTVLCDLPDRRPRGAVWLPNGTIVFGVRGDDEQTAGTLYAIPEQGGEPTVFAEPDAELNQRGLIFPSALPDGETLLFTFQSFRSGGGDIYAVPADGSADEVLLVRGRRNDTANAWSADGNYLIYTYFADDTAQDLMLVPVRSDGGIQPAGEPRPLLQTRRNEGWADVSPDGRYIVYDSNESGQFEIYVTPFPKADRRWQISSDGGSWPRWSPNGDEIFYVGGGVATGYGPILRVPVRTSDEFEADPAEVLFDGPQGVNFAWFSIAPDANRFLAVEKQAGQTPKVTLTLVQNWARAHER